MAHWTTCAICNRVVTYKGAIERGGKWYCPDCAPKERKPKAKPAKLENIGDGLTGG